jgi:hypothetical protein
MMVAGLIAVGLIAGALASGLGIGGGVIFVPVLVVAVGLDQSVAQGTSLAVIVPTALIGTYVHSRYGRVDWRAALPVAAGGTAGGLIGASTALVLDPVLLRRMFALLLVVLAIRLVVRQLNRKAKATSDT